MDEIGFQTDTWIARAATALDAERLAEFCVANPDYDVFLTGEVPDTRVWVDDFLNDVPPAHFNWRATHKLVVSSASAQQSIMAVIDVTEDMIARGVGHIGLFQVAQKLRGNGFAHELYQKLEDWLHKRASEVIRLGVLHGNPRGLAFWTRHGYQKTRERTGVAPTGIQHTSDVMFKPLKPMSLEVYRQLVPRDHPSSS
jgi:ribosomal protein S18 acetylase RimI-like enzyme